MPPQRPSATARAAAASAEGFVRASFERAQEPITEVRPLLSAAIDLTPEKLSTGILPEEPRDHLPNSAAPISSSRYPHSHSCLIARRLAEPGPSAGTDSLPLQHRKTS